MGGVLAVSRAFGDRPLKKYVISTPDVREEAMGGEDEILILASDGLWDVVSNKARRAKRWRPVHPGLHLSQGLDPLNLNPLTPTPLRTR